MTREPKSNESPATVEELLAILRGEVELNSPDIPLATAEEWTELGLSEPRTYASFNPLGGSAPRRPRLSKKKQTPPSEN